MTSSRRFAPGERWTEAEPSAGAEQRRCVLPPPPAPEARPARAPEPDEDRPLLLCAFPRPDGAELRIQRRTYKGRAFVDLRIFVPGIDGAMHPSPKGCTLRIRELDRVQAALDRVLREQAKGGAS